MKFKVFALYDVAAAVYTPLFQVRTEAEAIRSIVQAASDKRAGNMLAEYPHQFILHELGTFDDGTGVIECPPVINSLGRFPACCSVFLTLLIVRRVRVVRTVGPLDVNCAD